MSACQAAIDDMDAHHESVAGWQGAAELVQLM
jgi:hypothetical protein